MTMTDHVPCDPALGGVDALPLRVDGPADASLHVVAAHGAGAPMTSAFMTATAAALADAGVRVWRFDFPSMVRAAQEGRRRPPDRAPVCEAAWRRVLAHVHAAAPGATVVGAGKSMGGRMLTHVVADPDVDDAELPAAAVCWGYPLHPAGRPERTRATHLAAAAARAPIVFVQGDRDALCRLELMRPVVAACGTQVVLDVVDGADHDFKVRKVDSDGGRRDAAALAAEVAAATLRGLRGFGVTGGHEVQDGR
jgi:predicted alpha/beta-hydrolase family hydrolase